MRRVDRFVSALALVAGVGLYWLGRAPVLWLHRASPVADAGPVIALPGWAADSLPFALLCFAAFFALRREVWGWVAFAIAASAELAQLPGWLPGTFDPVDLAMIAGGWSVALAAASTPAGSSAPAVRVSPMRTGAVLTALVVVGLATSEDPKRKAEREAREKENLEKLDAYMATLAKVHDELGALDVAAARERPCDGTKMLEAEAVEHGHLNLRTVSLDFLARFGEGEAAWTSSEGPWSFLDDGTFAGHFEQHPDNRDAYAVKDTALRVQETFLAERYLMVVTPESADTKVTPVMHDDSFDSGYFRGFVFVVDQRDGSVACQFPVEVQSGESIDFGGRFDSKDAEKEMFEDFEDNFEAAITAKLPPKVKLGSSYGSILF